MAGKDVEIIRPPDSLKSKVTVTADGIDEEMLQRAEQVIADLKDNYLDWVQEDLIRIQDAYAKAVEDPTGRKEHLKAVFEAAHEIKGQGGSFDYPLMTVVGNQLCRFLEHMEEPAEADMEVVKLHIDAMRLIIAKRVSGDGGAVGDNLIKGLDAVLAKVAK